ncbi:MAG: hypothetical protein ACO3MA_03760 [Flavobacteriaceae bacterium]
MKKPKTIKEDQEWSKTIFFKGVTIELKNRNEMVGFRIFPH